LVRMSGTTSASRRPTSVHPDRRYTSCLSAKRTTKHESVKQSRRAPIHQCERSMPLSRLPGAAVSGRGKGAAVSPDECGGGGAGVDAELGVDVVKVLPHGIGLDPEALSDLRVRPALGDEIQDFPLARCEPGQALLLLEEQRAVNEVDEERPLVGIDA
jgi:hypothetical protein